MQTQLIVITSHAKVERLQTMIVITSHAKVERLQTMIVITSYAKVERLQTMIVIASHCFAMAWQSHTFIIINYPLNRDSYQNPDISGESL